tara:strand:- start:3952 stop:4251 length:300 start_codon:yes stop_codon:yes gene_type:complete
MSLYQITGPITTIGGTAVGNATTVGNASIVYINNQHTDTVTITIADSADATIGSFKLKEEETIFLAKQSSHQLFASNTAVEYSAAAAVAPMAWGRTSTF